MSIVVGQESEPTAPSASKSVIFYATDGRLLVKLPSGAVGEVSGGTIARNVLANGSFPFAQRQTPGTLTTYSNTAGRSYAADRWGLTNENASAQYRRVDTLAAFETGLSSRFYGEFKKITSSGKLVVSQVSEGMHTIPLRGRRVRVQFKAKNSVGSHTLRLALLQLTSSGTVDTIPATFLSAFGAASTDPTWGTNLSAIVPTYGSEFSTISGSGLSSVLTSGWRRYGGVFLVPTGALNLVTVIFTDGQMTAGDIVHLGEAGVFLGDEERSGVEDDYEHELLRCQRYYHKTFDVDVAPVQNIGSVLGACRWAAINAAGSQRSGNYEHPVRMRTIPTATTYNPEAANAQIRDVHAAGDCSSTAVQSLTDRVYAFQCTPNGSTAANNALCVHASFGAEL